MGRVRGRGAGNNSPPIPEVEEGIHPNGVAPEEHQAPSEAGPPPLQEPKTPEEAQHEALLESIAMIYGEVQRGNIVAVSSICVTKSGHTIRAAKTDGTFTGECVLHTMLQRQASTVALGMEQRDQRMHAQRQLEAQRVHQKHEMQNPRDPNVNPNLNS